MKCSNVRKKLFDYMDGALKGSDLREFEEHLKSCSECRHELEKVQQLDARLRQDIPAYLESIEPAPAFLNRLKSLELEPETPPGLISNMLDSFFSIFQEHRMAFGTGLAILIMIAIGLAIPTITHDEDEDEASMVAEATPTDSRAQSATQEPSEESMMMGESNDDMNKAFGSGAAAPETTSAPMPVPPPAPEGSQYSYTWDAAADEILTPSAEPVQTEPVPSPVPTSPPAPIAEAEGITDQDSGGSAGGSIVVGDDQTEHPATTIALNNPGVMDIVTGTTFSIEVLYDITEEDYTCDGPTVAITLEGIDPPGNLIYVCVDIENEEVEIKIWGE